MSIGSIYHDVETSVEDFTVLLISGKKVKPREGGEEAAESQPGH